MTNKMKLARYILSAISFIVLAACSGTVDPDSGTETKDPMKDVPEGVLRIFADKTEISADGNDEVTFTVMFGSEDVSNAKTLQLIRNFNGDEKYMAYGANKFSTVTAGTYTFSAKYYYAGNNYTDNSVTVEAKPFFNGEEKSYRQRVLGVYFTSTGCTSCPMATKGIKNLVAENPGKISVVAFHSDMGVISDPMTIPETALFNAVLGGFDGLPRLFWNMRKGTKLIGPVFDQGYEEEIAAYEPQCGVSIETGMMPSDYDGKPEDEGSPYYINIGITSNIPSVYRYLVFLVEDGIVAEQTGDPNYVHNNVVRAVLTNEKGDKINDNLPLTVGVEVKASKSVTLSKDWKHENMRVIVAAMTSEDGGYNWTVNNVNECKVGGSVSYLYEE